MVQQKVASNCSPSSTHNYMRKNVVEDGGKGGKSNDLLLLETNCCRYCESC